MGLFDKLKGKVREAIDETKTSIRETVDNLRYDRLKEGLAKTREGITEKLGIDALKGRKIDDRLLDELEEALMARTIADWLLDELEEALILADVGADTTIMISDRIRDRVRSEGFTEGSDLGRLLQEEIERLLAASPSAENDRIFNLPEEGRPHVIMVVGVNGVGKTTTIGKLAYNYRNAGYRVLIGAADTFRAAANEQLEVWAERAGVEIIGQGQGADPAAVAFDTLQAAVHRGADVVIIDTAGRLHNRTNLMEELKKMSRVMKKVLPEAPHEVFLVLDATTGQNAIQQAQEFTRSVELTGLVLTKLDGTAKGGVVIAIANTLALPVRYIGVGERIDDLQAFDIHQFASALFSLGDEA